MAVLITIIAENVTADAQELAPRGGRLPAIEIDESGAQTWLDAFAALPTYEAEDADARLHVCTPVRRVLVRHVGGRMILEEDGEFVTVAADEVLDQVLGSTEDPSIEEEAPIIATTHRARVRRQGWLLGGLVAVFLLLVWWRERPATPPGIVWMGSAESRGLLIKVAGRYGGHDEWLTLSADARLVIQQAGKSDPQSLTLRAGRRDGQPVLLASNGVILEPVKDGQLVANGATYERTR